MRHNWMLIGMSARRIGGALWRRLHRGSSLGRVERRVSTERLGSAYGGWVLCPTGLRPGDVVYSFGVGEEISFDLAIIERYGAQVHAFDPTPRSATWVARQTLPAEFVFHPYGLAGYDGAASFLPPASSEHVSHTMIRRPNLAQDPLMLPVKRLDTVAGELGHSRIAVLKMDIEGAEYEALPDILQAKTEVGQILIEFHHAWPETGPTMTRQALRLLHRAGWRVFSIWQNREYSFIRRP